jgi:hypothetical protein
MDAAKSMWFTDTSNDAMLAICRFGAMGLGFLADGAGPAL